VPTAAYFDNPAGSPGNDTQRYVSRIVNRRIGHPVTRVLIRDQCKHTAAGAERHCAESLAYRRHKAARKFHIQDAVEGCQTRNGNVAELVRRSAADGEIHSLWLGLQRLDDIVAMWLAMSALPQATQAPVSSKGDSG